MVVVFKYIANKLNLNYCQLILDSTVTPFHSALLQLKVTTPGQLDFVKFGHILVTK